MLLELVSLGDASMVLLIKVKKRTKNSNLCRNEANTRRWSQGMQKDKFLTRTFKHLYLKPVYDFYFVSGIFSWLSVTYNQKSWFTLQQMSANSVWLRLLLWEYQGRSTQLLSRFWHHMICLLRISEGIWIRGFWVFCYLSLIYSWLSFPWLEFNSTTDHLLVVISYSFLPCPQGDYRNTTKKKWNLQKCNKDRKILLSLENWSSYPLFPLSAKPF